MKRLALLLGLMLFLAAPLPSCADIPKGHENLPPGRSDMKEKGQEDDCDCCQKCKAATRRVQPEKEEGPAQKDGCEDCCKRCGRDLPVAPEQTPPDIIEKPEH